jgi:hypothetical protein
MEKAEDAAQSGIRNTESAKVFNIEGQQLDPNKPIMGGTQTGKELSPELSERLRGTNVDRIKQKIADKKIESDEPPPGSRGGKDDIAAPFQSAEESLKDMTEEEIKKNIEAQNKKGIENILKRKNREDVYGLEDYDTTNMSDIKKQIIRLETRLGNLNPELPGFRDRARVLADEIENLQKKLRDDKADGGRIGFKDGMDRRSFLKIMGGLAAIPVVGKFFKLAKTAKGIKSVPIVETAEVAGKPAWFDALVNKVIREGDDMTKQFATKEREIVHVKKLDEDTTVRVTQELDEGAVRVEYESPDNVFGDQVNLEYKKPLPDEGAPNPRAEFEVTESGPVGRQQSPDDYDIEIDEVGGNKIEDLTSDVSKLKEYATGKKPTMKEIVQNKKRKDKAANISNDSEAQMDDVIRRQGEMIDYDDYASGGIARMLGE